MLRSLWVSFGCSCESFRSFRTWVDRFCCSWGSLGRSLVKSPALEPLRAPFMRSESLATLRDSTESSVLDRALGSDDLESLGGALFQESVDLGPDELPPPESTEPVDRLGSLREMASSAEPAALLLDFSGGSAKFFGRSADR